jgi:Leucine-rich repeat (LRR) protein
MVVISTGIRDLDDLIAARGKTPPDATNVDDVGLSELGVTITRKTRNLERLAERPALRYLVARGPNDRMLSCIGTATGVEDLSLNGGTMTDLNPARGLLKLWRLSISVASRLRSLEGIEGLTSLQYLSLWACAALTSIAPLAGLRGLRLVFLDGNMYKPMRIDSLAPLAELRELEVVKLQNVRVRDCDLRPLHALKKLTRLELPDFFPRGEFDALAAALPAVQGRWKSRLESPSRLSLRDGGGRGGD